MTFTRLVRQLFESLRTVWLVLGVTLAFLFVLELCVRVTHYVAERQRARRLAAVPASLRDPQELEPWFADFTREYDATRPQRWKSYVYFGRKPSFKGRYVNIDADGHRVTPQPSSPAEPAARVFFMGGSTMWGTEQRDSATIAAVAAQRLQGLAGPAGRIEVTNFGESGYGNTQELLGLMLALRAGKRPDVVVFYDGINDVGTTVQYGVAGIPQNESKRVAEFDLGRAIDRSGFAQGMGKDLRALGALTGEALKQSELVETVLSAKRAPEQRYIAADTAARSVVSAYRENVRVIESMARAYGFVPIYVWQPSVHSTRKKLTPFEQRIRRQIAADSFQTRLRDVQLAVPALLDPVMDTIAPGRFVDADRIFDDDTLVVFVDRIGHNAERAVPRIVDAFWPKLEAAVTPRLHQSRTGAPLVTSSQGR